MSIIRQSSFNLYKKTVVESWSIGLLTGLLIAGFIALGFLYLPIVFFAIPLLCLPALFAAHLSHFGLRFAPDITFSKAARQFLAYYRSPFNSSFGFFSSLLKSFLVFLAAQFIFAGIGYYIAQAINPGVIDSMNRFMDLSANATEISAEALNEVLYANNNALLLYIGIAEIPSFVVAFMFFTYFISRNSIGIFLRVNIPSNNPQFIKYVQSYTNRQHRGRMLKDYWSLNWPLYLLMIIGAAGGAIGFSFLTNSPEYSLVAALSGAVLLSSFFLPFYLNNMEAIYDKYREAYNSNVQVVTQMIMTSIETNIQENIDEMEKLKKQFEENRNRDNSGDDSNKKDPNDFGS